MKNPGKKWLVHVWDFFVMMVFVIVLMTGLQLVLQIITTV